MKKQKNPKTTHKALNRLSLGIATAMAMMVGATSAQAADYKTIGDLEIYDKPKGGAVTIALMLDTSGSMGMFNLRSSIGSQNIDSVNNDYGVQCVNSSNKKTFNYTVPFTDSSGRTVSETPSVSVSLLGCGTDVNTAYLDRISRLKKALVEMLANGQSLPETYKVGAGNFSSHADSTSGMMAIPAKPLTIQHRLDLINYIKSLVAFGGTPSASAYAEVGAYMMGTSTLINPYRKTLVIPTGLASRNGVNQWVPNVCIRINQPSKAGTYDSQIGGNLWLGCAAWEPVSTFYPIANQYKAEDIPSEVYGWHNTVDRVNSRFQTSTNHEVNYYYYGDKVDTWWSDHTHSGFHYSADSTKKSDRRSYDSPISATENACDGYGIYFLTDGEPNAGNPSDVGTIMAKSLDRKDFKVSTDLPTEGAKDGNSGWGHIGAYAKVLKSGDNPSRKSIKTATLGFGKTFTDGVNPVTGKVANCDVLASVDAKNLCKLGELGGGGFTATSDPNIIKGSISDFAASLNNTIPVSPTGTISIPKDPMNTNSIQPYAYLPMIQPEVAEASTIWQGNLKKYNTLFGTLYGRDSAGSETASTNTRLYVAPASGATAGNANYPSATNARVMDLWQTDYQNDNSGLTTGGARNRIDNPIKKNSALSGQTRTVYVETATTTGKKMQKVGVNIQNGSAVLSDFDKLGSEYNIVDIAHIVNFLGFVVPVDSAYGGNLTGKPTATQLRQLQEEINKTNTSVIDKPLLGGVVHSVPVIASYEGKMKDGNISSSQDDREDYLLYGSMDGAVHLINAHNKVIKEIEQNGKVERVETNGGKEVFAFIPRAVFDDTVQRSALVTGSKSAAIGSPKFGVDAPWSVSAKYRYTEPDKNGVIKMTISGSSNENPTYMRAYGGLRMGGVGLYGLNIKDRNNPELLFSINDSTSGFDRMGQTWAKPLQANVRVLSGGKLVDKPVLFVGGGYDMCYENPKFTLNSQGTPKTDANNTANCSTVSAAKGNAVYMIDAENGSLLKSWVGSATATGDLAHMKHSIVSEIVGLDRNNNNVVDSIYFGDLGGQLFRIDLKENVAADNISNQVVRVFNANQDITDTNHLPYRFYEKPEVSFYDYNNVRLGLVNIVTGDRSSPTHKHRTIADANRIYGIIDRDLATSAVATGKLVSRNLGNNDLQFYDTKTLETTDDASRKAMIDALKDGSKQGWYYTMTRFDQYTNVKNLKGIGGGAVLGSIYYASIYSPEYNYTTGNSCTAKILGGTERQMFCLPWGICANPTTGALSGGSKNGTLGYLKAGPGIQEIAITTATNTPGKSTNIKSLASALTISEQTDSDINNSGSGDSAMKDAENFDKFGSGDDSGNNRPPLTPLVVATEQVLRVQRWYDLQTTEGNQ